LLSSPHPKGNGDIVNVTSWGKGTRLGNHLFEITHALILAEALGGAEVIFPKNSHDRIPILELPQSLRVAPNPELQSRARCPRDAVSTFSPRCEGTTDEDRHRALVRYIRPLFNQATRRACDLETNADALTIHLRSGDLLHVGENDDNVTGTNCNPQLYPRMSRQCEFAPCAFFEELIARYDFQTIRIITEADLLHPCITALKERHKGKRVLVQSRSVIEDACAIMAASNLAFGSLSTFAEAMALLSVNVRKVFVPWHVNCTEGSDGLEPLMKTISFTVHGMDTVRTGKEKVKYLLSQNASVVSAETVCNGRQLLTWQ